MIQGKLSPLWRVLLKFREYYPIILIYSVSISVLTLATPISVQSLVNTFSFGPYFQPVFVLSLILLALLIVLGVIKSLQYLVVEYLQRKFYVKVATVISKSYDLKEAETSVQIDGKANRYFDIVLVYKNLTVLVTDGISIALQTILGLILISLYHPFFIVFGVIIVASILTPLYLLGKKGLFTAVDESTSKYKVADYIDSLDRGNVNKANFEADTNSHIEEFIFNRANHFKTVFLQNIIYVGLYAFLNALLLALGGFLVLKNQLSVGQLVAAEIVVNAILSHFLYARKYLESFYDMYAAVLKVYPFFQHLDEACVDSKKNTYNNEVREAFYERIYGKISIIGKIYAPSNYKGIIKNFTGAFVLLSLTLLLVPWQQFSRAYGKVVAFNPNDRVQQITAPVEGIVEQWLVQDGQFVKKGDIIVRVVDNDPQYLTRLEAARDAAIAKFEAAKAASDTAKLNFHRQEKLVEEGLSSSKEFEQAKIKYKNYLAEEAAAVSSLAKAEVALSRQQQQDIVAPRDGQILRILVGSGTTVVKEGEALVDFVPKTEDNAVELYVDGNDLPLVYPGRKVRLQFEGWPAIQLTGWPSVAVGSFGGTVSIVDPSVSENGMFRVLVKPDPEDTVDWPDYSILRQGTRVTGIVNLDEVTIGYELWRQVNGFPKSMDQAPIHLDVKKSKKK